MDLIGQKFNRLIVIEFAGRSKYGASKYKCRCECGNEKIILANSLKSGNTKSCGCLAVETGKIKGKINGLKRRIHGQAVTSKETKEYKAWQNMKDRCYNVNYKGYKHYGRRGIRVCDKWLNNFETFFNDVGKAPSSNYSLDRINNDGNYEPGNVKWSTSFEQNQNRRKLWLNQE
ncbi:MAG TPA: hypothetical protein PLK61_09060 [Nitrosomonas sp.]|nr:hypothetical protein [Nitrosomonas sp.]